MKDTLGNSATAAFGQGVQHQQPRLVHQVHHLRVVGAQVTIKVTPIDESGQD